MNNKGTSIFNRVEITLMLLRFIWFEKNVAMIDVLLNEKDEWVHHIVSSNLLMTNTSRVKEIVKSFKVSLEYIFERELSK